MSKINNIIIVSLILICSVTQGQLENDQDISKVGTTAAQFLKISSGGRGLAMGSANVAITNNLSSSFWNPAGLAHVKGIQVYFENNGWLAGTDYNFGSFGFEWPRVGVLSLSITMLTTPDDLVRTIEKPTGTGEKFNAQDMSIGISLGKSLTNQLSLGATIKNIRQRIWHSTGQTIAADIGVQYKTPIKDIILGASISNFGNDISLIGRDMNLSVDPDPNNQGNIEFVNAQYETDAFPLPLLFRVGIGGNIINKEKLNVLFAIDAVHPNDNYEYLNLGLETNVNNMFSIRAGYPGIGKKDAIEGLSLGFGVKYPIMKTSNVLVVDYTSADFGPLGIVQRVSIGFNY
ncbi:MAG: hypothetical protein CBD77_04850 [bacterium TMED217]|nr:MAG: hypothetical protein CBD77_04850 [bacterium TMED217]|tara:strand:+ start:7969 stop:9006 length:1038 start_codon:yes stop_codon:yes gene_type:complete